MEIINVINYFIEERNSVYWPLNSLPGTGINIS